MIKEKELMRFENAHQFFFVYHFIFSVILL